MTVGQINAPSPAAITKYANEREKNQNKKGPGRAARPATSPEGTTDPTTKLIAAPPRTYPRGPAMNTGSLSFKFQPVSKLRVKMLSYCASTILTALSSWNVSTVSAGTLIAPPLVAI